MAIKRGFATTAMFAGLALGLAAPASAAPVMSGHYIKTSTSAGAPTTTDDWYFTPCGDGCAAVARGAAPGGQPIGQARVVNGQWTLDASGAPAACTDGSQVPSALSVHYTWDPNTLAGSVQSTANMPECGQPAGYQQTNNIQLRQVP